MALDLSFKQLIAAAEDDAATIGQPTCISIDRIDEDPDQPRRSFDEQKLDELAESVLQHGVLQPIVLRQATEDGRYVIVMGARRYRAAKRAGLRDLPAFVHAAGSADRYVQMIENIQRDDLNAPEIAAFIADRLEQGDNQADISRKLGKPRDWVSRYASVMNMPDFLRSKLAGSSIRAVYELYQAWREQPNAVETLCAAQESFTDAHARQLAREVRTKVRGSPADDEGAPGVQPPQGPVAPQVASQPMVIGRETAKAEKRLNSSVNRSERMSTSLTIRVRHQDRTGCLLVDRLASRGSRHAVLLIDGAEVAEEVPASTITIEEILSA
ncbi:ParB/RepB/Spo0J family partition protein [Bradyrhizobium elkanii]|uniref:ParB/RepB/Spo0J family partition protein n=1 Tax=Bradyrhizobium elkanii TaxID=29448 RepID=UPI0004AE0B32|nr:ParB/RepB/Spo0J family partition protein [Bradyrhizobium elkanii]MCS3453879.1 ParB family chromosome partitioning protein [Bradyrhizobium elkanii]MCS3566835.1 ParB family chromosome partitioning protein [Bradyrhizobium elkanii]MCW2153975.1 ParB family chromosome partitioning protein [Bradyrhizobium elkanii]MCW2380433.1 ParB family chromosome partitioning protein [Bradyrhizobium elkanii]WLC12607.1 ParB/RepB/Spo0J family partition protein [Bradyrhizobium elkanii USDA 94]